MSPSFFQTISGRAFFDAHIPELLKQLAKIAEELKRHNDREEAKLSSNSGA